MWQEVVLLILVEDVEKLKNLLPKFKKLINKPFYGRLTALQLALKLGHHHAAELLIQHGASHETIQIEGQAPLFYAIQRDDFASFKMLLSLKLDINQRNELGQTALMKTIQLGRRDMTATLLTRNALLDVQDLQGDTALHYTIMREDNVTLQLLLSSNPKLDIANNASKPPLVMALEQKDHITTRYFIQHKEHYNHGLVSQNPAIKGSDSAVHELYSRYGCELVPNITASHTPLMVTLLAHDLHRAKILIDEGADLEKVDGEGNTALLICCSLGQTAFVELLLELGADPLHRNYKQQTCLILAGFSGNLTLMRLLLKKGVDINAEDKYGDSLFIWALRHQAHDILKFCFEHRAEFRASDGRGTPSMVLAAMFRDFFLIEVLLRLLVPVDIPNVLNTTALMTCLQQSADWELILLLLNWGANVQHKNKLDQHVLDLAAPGRIARLVQAECRLQAYKIEGRRLYLSCARILRDRMSSPQGQKTFNEETLMSLVVQDLIPRFTTPTNADPLPNDLIEACRQRVVIPLMIVSGLTPSPKDYHDARALSLLKLNFERKEPNNFGISPNDVPKFERQLLTYSPSDTPNLTILPPPQIEPGLSGIDSQARPIMPLYNNLQDRSTSAPGRVFFPATWHKPPVYTPIARISRDSVSSQTRAEAEGRLAPTAVLAQLDSAMPLNAIVPRGTSAPARAFFPATWHKPVQTPIQRKSRDSHSSQSSNRI